MPRLSDDDYKFVFGNAVRLCVDLLLPCHKGYFVGKRAHEPFLNQYALPGGRVLFGESITDAVQRIGKDEIGIDITARKLIGYLEFLDEIPKNGTHSVSLLFKCAYTGVPQANTANFSVLSGIWDVPSHEVVAQHKGLLKYIGGAW